MATRNALSTVLFGLLCLMVAAGVAYFVARSTSPADSPSTIPGDPAAIGGGSRATVAASPRTIAPVVSFDARVVQDDDVWLLEAPVTLSDIAYRLIDPPVGVKALISGGPAGFDCAWAGTGQAPDRSVTARCTIPAEIRVIPGLDGIMALQFDEPISTDTALPVTAVLGATTQGQVITVNADGSHSLRAVQLGATDGLWIEITGGLAPDEQVLEFPTQRDFAGASE